MNQMDNFYDKLPFTLEENQLTPEYVIFGTGLQETLIAAYKSKMQLVPGLIIDTEKSYGSALKTLTFKEFNQLASLKDKQKMYEFVTPDSYHEGNQQFYEQSVSTKKHRGYSIDIEPSLFLAESLTCECLKQADMDKYMDFHLIKSILHIQDDKIKHVPLSKGKIFQTSDLSLFQKKHLLNSLHKLMKIYQKYKNVQIDMNSTKQFDKDLMAVDQKLYKQFLQGLDNIFVGFIQKMVKKNKKIVDFLTYIICNYQYNYQLPLPQHVKNSYTLKGFIQRFGKFIQSCGIYGQIPYLYVDNGIGDIPQAFSRIASIFTSVYILHPKVQISSITRTQDNSYQITTNLSPNKPIRTKQIYFGPTQLQLRKVQAQFYQQHILRVFVLVQKSGKQEACPAICFINNSPDFNNPVFMFLFDNSSHSCPSNMMIYQFETIIGMESGEQSQLRGEKLLGVLQKVYGEQFRQSIRYYSVYVRTRRYPKQTKSGENFGVGLKDTMGIDLDQHFYNFIDIIGKQDNYFKKDPIEKDEDEGFGYDAKYILQRMDELNLKEEHHPKEVEMSKHEQQTSTPVEQEIQDVPQIVQDTPIKHQETPVSIQNTEVKEDVLPSVEVKDKEEGEAQKKEVKQPKQSMQKEQKVVVEPVEEVSLPVAQAQPSNPPQIPQSTPQIPQQ